MHDKHRWRAASALASLIVLCAVLTPVRADDSTEVAELIVEADKALEEREYLQAAIAYRQAAEKSDSAEVARKATRVGFTYGFNEEAQIAGKRWVKLDKESQEARAYLGQIYFRLNDLRNSRRQYERLLKMSTGDEAGSAMGVVSIEAPRP